MTALKRATEAAHEVYSGAEERPFEHVTEEIIRRALTALRVDMNLIMLVAREVGEAPSTVDVCWTRVIDAILEERA